MKHLKDEVHLKDVKHLEYVELAEDVEHLKDVEQLRVVEHIKDSEHLKSKQGYEFIVRTWWRDYLMKPTTPRSHQKNVTAITTEQKKVLIH